MVFQVLHDWFGYDVLIHFAADGCQWYWPAALFLSPFLKMDATRVVLHWWGILPISRDAVNMMRWGVTSSANSFSTFGEILSGPQVLFILSPFSSLVTHVWCWGSPWQGVGWHLWMEYPPLLCWRWRHTVGLGCLSYPWHLTREHHHCTGCHANCISSFELYIAPQLLCSCLFVFASLFILILVY